MKDNTILMIGLGGLALFALTRGKEKTEQLQPGSGTGLNLTMPAITYPEINLPAQAGPDISGIAALVNSVLGPLQLTGPQTAEDGGSPEPENNANPFNFGEFPDLVSWLKSLIGEQLALLPGNGPPQGESETPQGESETQKLPGGASPDEDPYTYFPRKDSQPPIFSISWFVMHTPETFLWNTWRDWKSYSAEHGYLDYTDYLDIIRLSNDEEIEASLLADMAEADPNPAPISEINEDYYRLQLRDKAMQFWK